MLDRLTLLRQSFHELKLTAFLVSSTSNLRYLFGFTGSNGIGLLTESQTFFVSDWRYREQASQEVQNAEILIAFRDLLGALKEKGALRPTDRLGFESHHLNFRTFSHLRKTFPDLRLTATEHVIEKIAVRKTSEEIAAMRRAVDISVKVWDEVLPMIKAGVREADVAAEFSYRGRKSGADRDAFEPIVASGLRSALPHGISSKKLLAPGEVVVIDFGFVVDGYPSDITRTIAIGKPGERMMKAYEHVRHANLLAQERIRPGQKGKELDKVVRDYLGEHGLAEAFSHSLGHGLSLDVHSLPRIGPTSEDLISCGAVVTLEPGVYLADAGGIRIEDEVVVTETGCEVLTPITRELICVE
jgi:Xaa-Pro aminopeptidase